MVKKTFIIKSSSNGPKAVGPGNPPEHSRFKAGQSGNPKGRPKGARNLATILGQELRRKVTITIDDKQKQMAVQDVIARRLATDSMKGTIRAIELLLRITSDIRGDDIAGAGAAAEASMPDIQALRRIRASIDKLVDEGDK